MHSSAPAVPAAPFVAALCRLRVVRGVTGDSSRSTRAAPVPKLARSLSPMWPTRRKAPAAAEALLSKLHAHGWKTEAERDELLRSIAALPDIAAEDMAWMAVESDASVRQAGLTLLKRLPWEASSAALYG